MRSLSATLLVVNAVVIMPSLLLSAAACIRGSALARNRFLKHEIRTGVGFVVETLSQRAAAVSAAASLLANDSIALAAVREGGEAAVSALDMRVEPVQDSLT